MTTSPGSASPHILIVDDEIGIASAMTMVLEMEGYRISQAANGVQALERARESRPDLVVTDYMMPHLNGLELIRALRADGDLASLPVILMSAGIVPRAEAQELADAVLPKPIGIERLLESIEALLNR
jgi:CheY-like chemotaxis protein